MEYPQKKGDTAAEESPRGNLTAETVQASEFTAEMKHEMAGIEVRPFSKSP